MKKHHLSSGGTGNPDSAAVEHPTALGSNQDQLTTLPVSHTSDFRATPILGFLEAWVEVEGERSTETPQTMPMPLPMGGTAEVPSVQSSMEEVAFHDELEHELRAGLRDAWRARALDDSATFLKRHLDANFSPFWNADLPTVEVKAQQGTGKRHQERTIGDGGLFELNPEGRADVRARNPMGVDVHVAGRGEVGLEPLGPTEPTNEVESITDTLLMGLNAAVYEQVVAGKDDITKDDKALHQRLARFVEPVARRAGMRLSRALNFRIEDGTGHPYRLSHYAQQEQGWLDARGAILTGARSNETASDNGEFEGQRHGAFTAQLLSLLDANPGMSVVEAARLIREGGATFGEYHEMGLAEYGEERAQTSGRKVAVVVGNNYLGSNVSTLKGCTNDARAMASQLEQRGFEVHLHTEQTAKDISDLIRGLGSALGSGDQLTFYFAGHGTMPGKDNSGLVGFNGATVGHSVILRWMAQLSGRGVECDFVVDACFSGQLVNAAESAVEDELVAMSGDPTMSEQLQAISGELGNLSRYLAGHGAQKFKYLKQPLLEMDDSNEHHPYGVDGPKSRYSATIASEVFQKVMQLSERYEELTGDSFEGVNELLQQPFREQSVRLSEWRAQVRGHMSSLAQDLNQ